MKTPIRIGTAGWTIPKIHAPSFPQEGSHLERYARRLNAVEINSSFYRPHKMATYQRWAASVPPDFRFAVKMPRTITHDARLKDCDIPLDRFLGESGGLGDKLGVILIQLPPRAAFEACVLDEFVTRIRSVTDAALAIEPRHPSWFEAQADTLLSSLHVARVAADPPRAPGNEMSGGWPDLAYYRLHGSPKIYYSDYAAPTLSRLGGQLAKHQATGAQVWCIFDNTAAFAATANALSLSGGLRQIEPNQR